MSVKRDIVMKHIDKPLPPKPIQLRDGEINGLKATQTAPLIKRMVLFITNTKIFDIRIIRKTLKLQKIVHIGVLID